MNMMISTPTSYSKPGIPKPPAGWGKKLGTTPSYASDTKICC